jgi:ribosomal protein L11 methyltransferase
MPFLRIDIDITAAEVEAVENHCLALGAVAVTLVDQGDDPVLEPAPGEIRLWPATALQALFAADADGLLPDTACLLGALHELTGLAPECLRSQTVEDRSWEREWLRDFKPMQFGERLWIVPGDMPVPEDAAVVVHLDPGLAFGTGTHPTTAMCLRWLDGQVNATATLVDYGCGSGILAIAALALGAQRAQAFDIDARQPSERDAQRPARPHQYRGVGRRSGAGEHRGCQHSGGTLGDSGAQSVRAGATWGPYSARRITRGPGRGIARQLRALDPCRDRGARR